MRSENIVEEGVNGLRLFAQLSVPLRTKSSLQVSDQATRVRDCWGKAAVDSPLMENIDSIVIPHRFRSVSLLQVFHLRHAGCSEP